MRLANARQPGNLPGLYAKPFCGYVLFVAANKFTDFLHMRPLALCLALLGLLMLPAAPSVASEDVIEELKRLEERGLARLGTARLEDLLSVPAPRHSGVQFTRAWLDAQPAPKGGDALKCLSEALYFEARGETVKGQFAVAEVILNRVKSARFPDTVCDVINQGTGRKYACQFTYTCDGRPENIHEPASWERMGKVARLMLDGGPRPLTHGATYYHTTAVSPKWSRTFRRTAKYGVHLFYAP